MVLQGVVIFSDLQNFVKALFDNGRIFPRIFQALSKSLPQPFHGTWGDRAGLLSSLLKPYHLVSSGEGQNRQKR
jgi:hypothetical protein